MDYSRFRVEDFVADDYFLQWIRQNDPEAEKFWHLFVSLHPETKPKIDQARALVLKLEHATGNFEVADRQVENVWKGIQDRIDMSEKPERAKRFYHLFYRIAASVAVTVLFVSIGYHSQKESVQNGGVFESVQSSSEGFIEEVNTTDKLVRIYLADGSTIELAKNSRVRYRKNYDGQASRNIFLSGEAFFNVAKNARQPFIVHANEVVTKVLGTSFTVRAYGDDKNITVAVKSGTVSVFSPKKVSATSDDVRAAVEGVILLANQQVVYQRDQKSFEKTLVEAPAILSQSVNSSNFTFENASIPEVFRVLQNAYGIEIIFDEDVMKTCFITAPLGSEPLFEKLRIICRTIGATYEIIDTRVVINSSGCQ